MFQNVTELNAWLESTPLAEKAQWLEDAGLARGYAIPEDDQGREFMRHEVDRSIRAQFADLPYAEPEPEPEPDPEVQP